MEKIHTSSVTFRKKSGEASEKPCEPEDRQDFGGMAYNSGAAAHEKRRLWHRFVILISSRS